MAQMMEMITQVMRGETRQMNEKMRGMNDNLNNKMEANVNGMKQEMKEMRGEMQNMGAGLQDGLEQLKIGNGELRRATCWGRLVEVTEEVTVTETCTRETRREVTELVETREVVERLHGVEEEDAHTHTHRGSEGQWG